MLTVLAAEREDLETVQMILSCTAKMGLMLVQTNTWSGGSRAGRVLDVHALTAPCPLAKAQARP